MQWETKGVTLVFALLWGEFRWFTCAHRALRGPHARPVYDLLPPATVPDRGTAGGGRAVLEPVDVFWGIVAVLAVAAAWNHGWHHARPSYLSTRLARAAHRDGGAPRRADESPLAAVDVENSPRL
jgi:hypothetical protein